ncbi:MAG: hypothetical protein IPI38_18750 [Gemmatimonadetes bacterium]|nr:hypothetical protein [Gemmatimonadota bacterium]
MAFMVSTLPVEVEHRAGLHHTSVADLMVAGELRRDGRAQQDRGIRR